MQYFLDKLKEFLVKKVTVRWNASSSSVHDSVPHLLWDLTPFRWGGKNEGEWEEDSSGGVDWPLCVPPQLWREIDAHGRVQYICGKATWSDVILTCCRPECFELSLPPPVLSAVSPPPGVAALLGQHPWTDPVSCFPWMHAVTLHVTCQWPISLSNRNVRICKYFI